MSDLKTDFDSIEEATKTIETIANAETRAMNYYAPLFISNSKGNMTDKTNELYNELVRIHKNLKGLAFRTLEVIEDTSKDELCDD